MRNTGILYNALWLLGIILIPIGVAALAVGKIYIGGLFIGLSVLFFLVLPEEGWRQKFKNRLKLSDESED